ncbi:hypothetical protein GCM10011386_43950 [Parapedobacter defluvii]|uniref:Uncharacterized protein n=1 Tax=Parapedobacter defluvii TaxID=2045106 RepID=A0ABQ1MU50_9SPHI|nr:hypothetical protein [Parapedobacter defluvii]GGC47008.1 hypothetical protein GCM10011386_43950 [Parapedobacter defluvii]
MSAMLKATLNLTVIFLIIIGIIFKSEAILITASALFIVNVVCELIFIAKQANDYKQGRYSNPVTNNKKIKGLQIFLEVLLVIFGMFSFIYENSYGLKTSGKIIWFSIIGAYIFGGIIISEILKIPIRMGYGGWTIDKRRRKI